MVVLPYLVTAVLVLAKENGTMRLSEIRKRLSFHGINVYSNVLCPVTLSKVWRYAIDGKGSGHFNTKQELIKYLLQVENIAMFTADRP